MHNLRRALTPVFLSFMLLLLCAVPAAARKEYPKRIAARYKLLETDVKCTICHTSSEGKPSKRNLNVFGKDLREAMAKVPREAGADRIMKAIEAIADKDSDGDGATNLEEIVLGTSPGDAASKPDPEKLAQHRRDTK